MKAVIMEIKKGYCIVLTGDGRFLKQEIPPGVFEIGDEIIVNEEYVFQTKRMDISRVKTLSLAASILIILATVSFFSFWYMKHYNASRRAAASVGDYAAEDAAEADADADADAEREIIVSDKDYEETVEKRSIIFEETYYIDEQKESEEDIDDTLGLSYKIINDVSLRVKLKNISSASKFNGTLTIVLYLSDNSESKSETVSIEELEPGQTVESPLFLNAEEVKLKVQINGNAY
ncbi:MAG: anti-sigma factor domain-containing protein [Actinomycetota bacterium]|nr:anti-sigma factor domain-containing protein [Actinomycetota bacterium]